MVSIDLIFALIFYSLILLFFLKTRKNWQIQGGIIALYRTKIGLSFMDVLAKKDTKKHISIIGIILSIMGIVLLLLNIFILNPYLIGSGSMLLLIGLLIVLPLRWLGNIGVVIGFIGMIFIFFILIKSSWSLFFVEGAQSTLAPVLPGVHVPGLPTLSFWHWIVSIFILAVVHEFSHGIIARLYQIKVKSSGIGFLGPILLAFVEPDEKQISRVKKSAQLSIFAAGPFSNILLGALSMLFFLFILAPMSNIILEYDGISVSGFSKGFPAEKSGLEIPFTITAINGIKTISISEFINATKDIKPDQEITLTTNERTVAITTIQDPKNATKGFMGIEGLSQKTKTKNTMPKSIGTFFTWFSILVMWTFFINIGVGLFNLLPLGPIDGGRMFFVVATKILKDGNKAKKAWMITMYIVLFLIFINLIPWLNKLIRFIAELF